MKFYRSYGRLLAKNRNWSLTDLSKNIPEEDNRSAYIKRWNSLSNDELVKFREDKYFMEPMNLPRFPRGTATSI